MFYQVRVRPEDCNYLRFLWWPNGNLKEKPREYQMLVHLFRGASLPSCANYALKKTAEDNIDLFDEKTTETVKENFYVDDCLRSVGTESQALQLVQQLCDLLAKGGFRLTKWISNSQKVIDSIPEGERAASVKNLDLNNSVLTERALGVQWQIDTDSFGFKISNKEKPLTRRGILSNVSSVYDPLGFVSPCILTAKAILQDLCQRGLDWDDEIPEDSRIKWQTWLNDLPKLENFSIPRCLKPPHFENIVRRELHHFCDASSKGYGAVSYLRQVNDNGEITCSLVMAKSRLAPLKTMTIPRMELSAAVLATRLDKMILQELTLPIDSSTFWTDSTCVLRYIENKDKRFQVFVANRIAAIHNQSTPAQWRYVETSLNPADEASIGSTVDEFLNNDRWKQGPSFLAQSEETWPLRPTDLGPISNEDVEVRKSIAYSTSTSHNSKHLYKTFERFSSWMQLTRVIAWVLRYKRKLQNCLQQRKVNAPVVFEKTIESINRLSVEELRNAENDILAYVQRQEFKDEIPILCNQRKDGGDMSKIQNIKKSSSIFKLDPIFEQNIIRVGGRLQKSTLNYDAKHPIILPKGNHVSKLIIRHYHQVSAHSGLEYTLSLMRERYWIVGARSTARGIIKSCFSCRKRQAPVLQQKMSSLPESRLTPYNPPFTFVGVDCFGPFTVRRGRTTVKRYGVLFTCLSTRVIHIEIAHSMDTDSFINALRRMIARRGRPREIISDNGGNFVKGEKELKAAIKEWKQNQIYDTLLQQSIKWSFNPPAGPHHGGVWERCIRTVRKVLSALIKEQTLDDEALSTLMCEVESIVNGRPLTKLSDDPKDSEPLTPNHLLLLRSGSTFPPGNFTKEDYHCRRRWRQIQYLSNVFWKRWLREYLPSLQERQKWNLKRRNLAVDDVVLILDDNVPRSSWPLARVIEIYQNHRDGMVRSAKLKTSKSELT